MTDLVEHAQPETQVSGGQDASFESTINDITEAPAQEQSKPQSLDDSLSAIYDRMNGKAPPEKPATTAKSAAVETPAPTPNEPAPVAAPAADYPTTWDASLKDTWGKLPPEAQKYIAEREASTNQILSRQQQALKFYEPVAGVLSTMNQLGVQRGAEAEMIQNWMNADRFLSQDAPNAIKWLAQQFNVDLNQLVGAPKQDAQQSPIDDLFKDPRYDTLQKQFEATQRELMALKQQQQQVVGNLTAREQAEVARQTEYINKEIAKFAQEKPYFSQLEEDITHEVNLIKAREPGLPIDKLLEKAYDRAAYANPSIREKILTDQRKAETEKQQKEAAAKAAQAKKLSSMNVRTGASASTPTFDGRWDDGDKLSALYDRISAGRS